MRASGTPEKVAPGRWVRRGAFLLAAFFVALAALWAIGDGREWTGLVGIGLFFGCLWAAGEPSWTEGDDG